MKDLIKVMKALSDPNRVRIVKLLQQRALCVCELQAALAVSQPTVSKHLKLLEEAGLVSFRKEGQWVNYFLADGSSSPYAAALLEKMAYWLDQDPEIASLLAKLPGIDREWICGR
jgi:ArsR family transcriptional regulator